MPQVLQAPYFASRDTVRLARELLGKRLVITRPDGAQVSWAITETEAYDGPDWSQRPYRFIYAATTENAAVKARDNSPRHPPQRLS